MTRSAGAGIEDRDLARFDAPSEKPMGKLERRAWLPRSDQVSRVIKYSSRQRFERLRVALVVAGAYLNPVLRQVRLEREHLARVDVGIVRVLEGLLEFFELIAREDGSADIGTAR